MVDRETYDLLKNKYGKVSSWAIWADAEDDKPASNVDKLDMFEDVDSIIKELKTDYVFVGLNAASHGEEQSIDDWRAFHSTCNHKQRDYKLRQALKGSVYWGAYITDVIKIKENGELKGIPETRSKIVMEKYNSDPDIRRDAAIILKEELRDIGGTPTLIAFGNYAYRILCEMQNQYTFLKGKRIIKATHYSYVCNEYKKRLNDILEKEKLPGLK